MRLKELRRAWKIIANHGTEYFFVCVIQDNELESESGRKTAVLGGFCQIITPPYIYASISSVTGTECICANVEIELELTFGTFG